MTAVLAAIPMVRLEHAGGAGSSIFFVRRAGRLRRCCGDMVWGSDVAFAAVDDAAAAAVRTGVPLAE